MNRNNNMNGFPGRWIGGVCLLLGPILMLIGIALRSKYHFFFPDQLEAYQAAPTLMTASYSAFLAGNILMFPAVLAIVQQIREKSPSFALWGGMFVCLGLLARTFHAGIDHLAFQISRVQGVELATDIVANSYGAFHIMSTLNLAIMLGWIVLAIGALRAHVLNLIGTISLALMAGLPLGVLKGTATFSWIAVGGLCVACIPLGVKLLKNGPQLGWLKGFSWMFAIIGLIAIFYIFGRLG